MSDKKIQNLFSAVARHYDFLNALLSLRRDKSWRRETVKASHIEPASKVLDVCTGTGELALAYRDKISAEGFVIGSDFCFDMLVIGERKVENGSVEAARMEEWKSGRVVEASNLPSFQSSSFPASPSIPHFLAADTLTLPFLDDTFDVVSVGFGIRNVSDLEMGIREMTRGAAPGGRVVILEFTQPTNLLFRSLYYFYFTKILPFIGNRISGSEDDAYGYLPRSVMKFPNCDALKDVMEQCGLTDVQYYRKTFGIVAIHVGRKLGN